MDRDTMVGTFGMMGLGLTLTKANRVLLTEPNMMPSTEKQGIAGAVRFGQSKPVEVVRLRTEQ